MSYQPCYEAPEQISPDDDGLTDDEREDLEDAIERQADADLDYERVYGKR